MKKLRVTEDSPRPPQADVRAETQGQTAPLATALSHLSLAPGEMDNRQMHLDSESPSGRAQQRGWEKGKPGSGGWAAPEPSRKWASGAGESEEGAEAQATEIWG